MKLDWHNLTPFQKNAAVEWYVAMGATDPVPADMAPDYSYVMNVGAAMELVEKEPFKSLIIVRDEGHYACELVRADGQMLGVGPSTAEALCMALLKFKGIKF